MKKITLALASLAILLPGLASAGTITTAASTIADQETNWTHDLTFAKFDTSLGTLNSVRLDFSGALSGSILITSFEETAGTVVHSSLAASLLATFNDCTITCSVTLSDSAAFDDTMNFLDEASHSPLFGSYSGSTGALTEGSLLAAVSGIGTFTIPVSAVATSATSGTSNLESTFITSGSASGTITYEYTDAAPSEAPEPASMVLFGSALAGLGIARRRKMKQ